MKNKKQAALWAAGLAAVFAVFGLMYARMRSEPEPVFGTAFKLNTVVTVKIYEPPKQELIDEVMALCDQYEELFSRTKETSEIYRLNSGALPKTEDGFTVSPKTAELIAKGLEYGQLSGGAFDIAIEPVSSQWDFTSGEKTVPPQSAIDAALPLVDHRDVILTGNSVAFRQEGMGLDLGAIAKGFIADEMKDYLISKGVTSATINLGGNVLCIGDKPDGTPFRIGIQKPFAQRSETICTVDVSGKSVVSSGVYERYFEKDGRMYHHILDPATGYPCDTLLVSVTIVSDKSTDGDGLSTTCFALGLEKGMALIDSLPEVYAVFITDDGEVHYSAGFPEI